MQGIIDTLQIFERLKRNDLSENAAREIAEVFKETNDGLVAELATKDDLKTLEIRLKHDLTLRLGGMIAIAVATISVLDKLL